MLGYYENPSATRNVLKNGRLYTGDLGYIDDEAIYILQAERKMS